MTPASMSARGLLALLAAAVTPVFAECALPEMDYEAMRRAHYAFVDAPAQDSAVAFLATIPARFCQFSAVYGYHATKGIGPLYDLPLNVSLPALAHYIDPDELAARYVALAAEAHWDADSVNFLQHAYRTLLLSHPQAVMGRLAALPDTPRGRALAFLFDGPYPANSAFSAAQYADLCATSQALCAEIRAAQDTLGAPAAEGSAAPAQACSRP